MGNPNTTIKIKGLSTVESAHPGEFVKIPAGGYVCVIRKVSIDKTKTDKYKMMFTLDIAEGEFARAFENSQYPPIYQQLIYDDEGNASRYFKGILEDIQDSNSDWKISADDTLDFSTLIGKKVGFLFGEREYLKRDGSIGTFMEPRRSMNVKRIRNKEFAIPQLRKVTDEDRKFAAKSGNGDDDEFIQDEMDDNRAPF